MLKWNRHKTAVLLIFSSLTLLLIFLFNWVNAAYERESQALRKDVHYTFQDIIGSIEDSLVHKVFLQNATINVETQLTGIKSVKKKKTIKMDSVNMVFTHKSEPGIPLSADSTVHMFVQTFVDTAEVEHSPGLLPILINWRGDSLDDDFDLDKSTDKAVELITAKFGEAILESDLPKEYEIVKSPNDSKPDGFAVDFYHAPNRTSSYAVVFSDQIPYLIKKIKQSILFSLLLFGAISLSFYMIYSNWREQQKMIDLKNDFISNVTHELKTPISTVSVALEALSSFDVIKDKVKTQEYLQISKKELGRLKILVDKVLKMSIFEKGAAKLHIETLQFDELLDEVLSSMKIQFEKKNAEVNKELIGTNFSIEVDKIHLTNVVYNLLDNAIKYCTSDPVINIKLTESNDGIQLSIEDNGIGIPQDAQSKVFNRFYRVPSGDTHNVKGHGLGLSYVASVIDQHNGSIALESKIDHGTKFNISLSKIHENN